MDFAELLEYASTYSERDLAYLVAETFCVMNTKAERRAILIARMNPSELSYSRHGLNNTSVILRCSFLTRRLLP